MKKKILMFLIALFMFIPLTIVKASDVTIDQIITKINERIETNDSFIYGVGTNISATKLDNNKIKVTATTDLSDIYASWPQGFVDDIDMEFTSFIIYEYQNSILSYKGQFGYIDEETIDYKTSDKDYIAELLSAQNELITKEMIYVLYNLKTQENYQTITTYLRTVGLEKEDGGLSYPTENLPSGITITKDGEGWVTEYSINLSQINIPESTNNNNTNTNNNNNQTTTPTDNLAGHAYATDDNNFTISFIDDFEKEFIFRVESLSEAIKNNENNKELNKIFDAVKDELKDNGSFIDLYDVTVKYESNNEEKTKGIFTFRIKITDEMKKYDAYELINIEPSEDKIIKNDIVKAKIEGDYIVGELPHLSQYALVGKNTPNPGTGIAKYTITGIALLLGTFGVYALYKRKSEI